MADTDAASSAERLSSAVVREVTATYEKHGVVLVGANHAGGKDLGLNEIGESTINATVIRDGLIQDVTFTCTAHEGGRYTFPVIAPDPLDANLGTSRLADYNVKGSWSSTDQRRFSEAVAADSRRRRQERDALIEQVRVHYAAHELELLNPTIVDPQAGSSTASSDDATFTVRAQVARRFTDSIKPRLVAVELVCTRDVTGKLDIPIVAPKPPTAHELAAEAAETKAREHQQQVREETREREGRDAAIAHERRMQTKRVTSQVRKAYGDHGLRVHDVTVTFAQPHDNRDKHSVPAAITVKAVVSCYYPGLPDPQSRLAAFECSDDGDGNLSFPIIRPQPPTDEQLALAAQSARAAEDRQRIEADKRKKRVEEDKLIATANKLESERRRRDELAWATRVMSGEGPTERTSIPRHVKIAVYDRDGGVCRECGSARSLQYDHIIPLAKGGSNSIGNLQLLCDECNQRKGSSI